MVGASRGSVTSVYGLLFLGVSALGVAVLPGVTVFRRASVFDVVTGTTLFDWTTVVISGGSLLVGIGAICIGSLLASVQHRT
jgi:hypothetical protein